MAKEVKMVKVRLPVTVHNGVEYVPPGTEVEMDEKQAARMIELHGEYGGKMLPQDPANTDVLTIMDEKSIEDLNTYAEVNGGHGMKAPRNAAEQSKDEADAEKKSAAAEKAAADKAAADKAKQAK